MSFTQTPERPARLNRSQLAVPASQLRMIEKAATSEADVVFLDLEDAVAPAEKETARQNVVDAVNQKDWGKKSISFRVNGLDTHYMYRDLIDVVENCGQKLDLVMVPKVGTAADVYAVDMLLTQIEVAKGFTNRIGIEVLIESALGMQNIHDIAQASPRLEALHLGAGDYSASLHAKTTHIGGTNSDYSILSGENENGRPGRTAVVWTICHTLPRRPVGASVGWSRLSVTDASRSDGLMRRTMPSRTRMYRHEAVARSPASEGSASASSSSVA